MKLGKRRKLWLCFRDFVRLVYRGGMEGFLVWGKINPTANNVNVMIG